MEFVAAAEKQGFWLAFWRLMQPFRPLLKWALLWTVVMQVLALLEPAIITTVVDDIVKNGKRAEAHLFLFMLAAFLGLAFIGFVKVVKDRAVHNTSAAIYHHIQVWCAEKLYRLPLSFHQQSNSGELIGKVTRGTGKIMEVQYVLMFEIAPLIIQAFLSTVVLLYLHWKTTIVLVPVVAAFAYVTDRVKRMTRLGREKRHVADNRADALLGAAVTNIMTVQAFMQDERELKAFGEQRDINHHIFLAELEHHYRHELARNAIVSFGRISLLFICARAVFGDVVSIGTMILMVTLAERIFVNCYRMGGIYDRAMDAEEPVKRILELLSTADATADPVHPEELPAARGGSLVLEDVNFSYHPHVTVAGEERVVQALCGVNLEIRRGQMVGIIGRSGSGKSTLAKLLLGFYRPDTGMIKLDGRDIRRLRYRDVRQRIGFVPQEVELFDDTIAANIAYGKPEASQDEIEAAAKAANAHDFILRAGGYGILIGDRGLRLSGGQRQRLGIARALLIKPEILILDEATSSVDPETIHEIKEALSALRGQCTLIVITHQLATIKDADRIIVLREGRVEAVGKHGELARSNDIYATLLRHQQTMDLSLSVRPLAVG